MGILLVIVILNRIFLYIALYAVISRRGFRCLRYIWFLLTLFILVLFALSVCQVCFLCIIGFFRLGIFLLFFFIEKLCLFSLGFVSVL